MADLLHQIYINASPEKVMKAISTTPGLKGWWTEASKAEPRVGHVNVFAFDDGKVEFHFRVDEQRSDGVVWTCIAAPNVPEEWVGTRLTFDLESDDEGTRLRFAHRDWKNTEGYFAQCNTVWGELMHLLRDCAEGKGDEPYFQG